jgi:hypothetical protein
VHTGVLASLGAVLFASGCLHSGQRGELDSQVLADTSIALNRTYQADNFTWLVSGTNVRGFEISMKAVAEEARCNFTAEGNATQTGDQPSHAFLYGREGSRSWGFGGYAIGTQAHIATTNTSSSGRSITTFVSQSGNDLVSGDWSAFFLLMRNESLLSQPLKFEIRCNALVAIAHREVMAEVWLASAPKFCDGIGYTAHPVSSSNFMDGCRKHISAPQGHIFLDGFGQQAGIADFAYPGGTSQQAIVPSLRTLEFHSGSGDYGVNVTRLGAGSGENLWVAWAGGTVSTE